MEGKKLKHFRKLKVEIELSSDKDLSESRAIQMVSERMRLFGEVSEKLVFTDAVLRVENYTVRVE